jgi:hypothetical protein
MPNHHGLYCSDVSHQRVHRVAMANFWRTFHHDGKISPAGLIFPSGEGGGAQYTHAPPFIRFTITYKVAVYAPTERASYTPRISSLPLYVLCSLTQDRRNVSLEISMGCPPLNSQYLQINFTLRAYWILFCVGYSRFLRGSLK